MKEKYLTTTNNGYVYLNDRAFRTGIGTCYISEGELEEKHPCKYTRRKLKKLLKNWVFDTEEVGATRIKKSKLNYYLEMLWQDLSELGWCDPCCFIDEWDELPDEDFEPCKA